MQAALRTKATEEDAPLEKQSSQHRQYKSVRRDVKDKAIEHLKANRVIDEAQTMPSKDYMQYLSPTQRRAILVNTNYDNLIEMRRQLIDEQFKPLELFYER